MTPRKKKVPLYKRTVKVKFRPVRAAILASLALTAFFVLSEPGTAVLLIGALDAELL